MKASTVRGVVVVGLVLSVFCHVMAGADAARLENWLLLALVFLSAACQGAVFCEMIESLKERS
jgi:hypothetical protein